MKFNYMKISKGQFRWRQVEVKDGKVFMRLNVQKSKQEVAL